MNKELPTCADKLHYYQGSVPAHGIYEYHTLLFSLRPLRVVQDATLIVVEFVSTSRQLFVHHLPPLCSILGPFRIELDSYSLLEAHEGRKHWKFPESATQIEELEISSLP